MSAIQKLVVTLAVGLVTGLAVTYCCISWFLRDQEVFARKIKIRPDQLLMENENRTMADEIGSRVSILCLMIVPRDGDGDQRTLHIKETWGKRCNILIFLGPTPDSSLPILRLIGAGKGEWDRIVTGMKYAHDYYLNHVDWFFYAGIRTYAVLENLRHMLYNFNGSTYPVYFIPKDYKRKDDSSLDMIYILSREALRRLVEVALPNPNLCTPPNYSDEVLSQLNNCLMNVGVIRKDALDSDKKERFLPISFDDPNSSSQYRITHTAGRKIRCLNVILGVDCFSNTPLAFGEVSVEDMYVLEYLIYHLRPFGVTYNPAFKFSK